MYKDINSKDNAKIKFLRKLSQKKYRDSFGLFVVENLKIIEDSGVEPEQVFAVNRGVLDKLKAKDKHLITSLINKSFSSLDTPSGVVAVYKKKSPVLDLSQSIIYLNAVGDPGNLGTILRTALAFGFKNLVLDEHCADIYNPKTISSAKDSIFKLNFEFDKDLKILKKIKSEMKIYSTNLQEGKDVNKIKDKQLCIVFGSESNGVDKKILKISDGFIKIEMTGEMESLNVAVATGIIIYIISNSFNKTY